MNTNLQNNNSDLLSALPTDKNQPTHSELKIVDTLFKDTQSPSTDTNTPKPPKSSTVKIVFQYMLLVFLVMLFYFIPNDTIKKFMPVALSNNELAPIFVKSVCVSIIFYAFQVYYIKVTFS